MGIDRKGTRASKKNSFVYRQSGIPVQHARFKKEAADEAQTRHEPTPKPRQHPISAVTNESRPSNFVEYDKGERRGTATAR